MNWYTKKDNEVLKELKTSTLGLTTSEAEKRLEEYGLNALPKKERESIFSIFFKGFLDPLVILLLVTFVFSLIINEVVDAFVILFIVFMDLILGTYQEWKAKNNADSLAKLIKVKVMVRRDKTVRTIDSLYLVPGDIVYLSSGDKIPADMRVLESDNLKINESILTGESIDVYKTNLVLKNEVPLSERKNMVYSGSVVTTGRATCVVVATALKTEIGSIAQTLSTKEDTKSPLTIRMNKFTKQISILTVIIAIIITIILATKNLPSKEIFLSVIALTVSAMPEGLPLALTMALTIASNRMAKKRVIVKKLTSVESLGSCTIIASDKTGTLTINEQTAKKIVIPGILNYDIPSTLTDIPENLIEIIKFGALNNEAKKNDTEYIGDSIDIAFLKLGEKAHLKSDINILKTIPYESENGYSALFYEENNKKYVTIKGSIEKVLACSTTMLKKRKIKIDKDLIRKENTLLAQDGLRVIALAKKELKNNSLAKTNLKDMTFLGLVAFIDPVRKEAKKSIAECTKAGIKVVMITGDHHLTAYNIAKTLGIAQKESDVATTFEIANELKKGEASFQEYVKTKNVFSRVTPLEKLEIVNAFKRNGEFIAVTGDGVNDTPALKAANLGISMGSGTDIAIETSNMILEDDDFTSIVEGLKEGRTAYNNIRKVSYLLISCGLAEVLFFVLSIIMDLPMPLVAIQLLWLNIVTDGLQDFALSFEQAEPHIMNEQPRSPKESMFNKELMLEVALSGLTIGLLVFFVWTYLLNRGMNTVLARSYVMALMVFIQNFHTLNCRSEKESIFKMPFKSNPLVILTIIGSILLQVIVMENATLSKLLNLTPVPFPHLINLFALSTIILFVMEIYKVFKRKMSK